MSTQAAVKITEDQDLIDFREALRKCVDYHKTHDPIMPGSFQHGELKRLWEIAIEKGHKCFES